MTPQDLDPLFSNPSGIELSTKQREIVTQALHRVSSLIQGEMGSGKSRIAVTLIKAWLHFKLVKKVLLIVRAEVINNFKKLLLELIPELTEDDIVIGGLENRGLFDDPSKIIYMTDYNGIKTSYYHIVGKPPRRKKGELPTKKLRKRIKDVFGIDKDFGVVCDEIQYLKAYKSDVHKIVYKNTSGCRALVGLTGTPVDKIEEMHSIFQIINESAFGSNYYFFIKDIAETLQGTGRIIYYNEDAVRRYWNKIEPYILRISKADIKDNIPQKHIKDFEIDMGEYEPFYRKTMEDVREYLKETGGTVAGLITQIYNTIKIPDEKNPRFVFFKNLVNRILGMGERLIIWEHSPDIIKALSSYFTNRGIKNVYICGEVDKEDRVGIIKSFDTDPEIKILLASTYTTADSWEIPSRPDCHRSIFYSLPTKSINYRQSMDRQHRINSQSEVYIYRLFLKNTIDFWARDLLDYKIKLLEGVIDKGEYDKVERDSYKRYLGIDNKHILD